MWSHARPARLGPEGHEPTAKAVVALLSDFFPKTTGEMSTSTAACTPRAPELADGGGSVPRRPRHWSSSGCSTGPNLYFPRPAVKVTLDIERAGCRCRPRRLGAARRRARAGRRPPGPPGLGVPAAVRRPARRPAGARGRPASPGRPGWPSGSGRPATLTELVVAYPWRHRGRAEALATGVADVLDALAAATDVELAVIAGRAGRGSRRPRPAAAADRSRPRIPVVAVTGTNGKTTTSRMIGYIAQRAGLVGRLVEHRRGLHRRRAGRGRRLLRAERRRAGAGLPGRPARGHRDRPRRHPAARRRRGLQRRLGGHQHQRRPPRPAAASTPSTSWPRSRR